jgi:hypothetical protein
VHEESGITARAEIRTSEFGQLRCPSCGALAGDIAGRHHLIVTPDGPLGTAECDNGERVPLADFAALRAAMNIATADAWFEEIGLRGTPGT